VTNILSFAEVADKFEISYDHQQRTFTVQVPNGPMVFRRRNNLYVYFPDNQDCQSNPSSCKSEVEEQACFVETVQDNMRRFTKRQLLGAARARELYHSLGRPSLEDFKKVIKANMIHNNPVTLQDVQVAEEVYGRDVGALKGKSTRCHPMPIVEDYVEIPKVLIQQNRKVALCMDVMKVNGLQFLTTVSKRLKYRTAQYLVTLKANTIIDQLRQVFLLYNSGGFLIGSIDCDNGFRSIRMELMERFNLEAMYFSLPDEHEPYSERNNRVIKERVRATFHGLPYQSIPKIMVITLVMESARKLNMFPPKDGLSDVYSPRAILHQVPLDYKKHCSVPFGTYVQANNEAKPTNSQKPRTLDCIYLKPTDNPQGGHQVLDLSTGRTRERPIVHKIPVTEHVIQRVNALAKRQHMPMGLKVQAKDNTVLYDSAWIAGVDYSVEQDEEHQGTDEHSNDEEADEDQRQLNEQPIEEEPVLDQVDPDDESDAGQEVQDAFDDANEEELESQDSHNPSDVEIQQDADDDQESIENDNDARPTRTTRPVQRLDPTWTGQSYSQARRSALYNQDDPDETDTRSPEVFPCHLQRQIDPVIIEWDEDESRNAANIIHEFNCAAKFAGVYKSHTFVQRGMQFIQTYSLKRGLKQFGERGYEAAFGEMKQLHDRSCFTPIDVSNLTEVERKRALESLIFLVEKRDGRVKARTCANGSVERAWMAKEGTASPTTVTESILLTAVIDAEENRDVATVDIPNAFIQTDVENNDDGSRVIMKIRGPLVDMLVELDPETYGEYVRIEGGNKVIYVHVLKAIYGMLKSAMLFYKKLRKDLESIGFVINPYDPCVANRMIDGKQHTVVWHVDDLKSSHVNPRVNDKFIKWLEKMYAPDPKVGKVKAVRGKIHDYLAMVLDYSTPGQVKVNMTDYVKSMVGEFAEVEDLSKMRTQHQPWTEGLFRVNNASPALTKEKAEIFHTMVAKGIFVTKRARQDIQPAIAFLCTRVKAPTEEDWGKLKRMIKFLSQTQDDVLTLKADGTNVVKWSLDAAFAVHPDMKSHTGAVMTLGKGSIMSASTKQKVNTRSSTEAELVSVDDVISKIIWTLRFLQAQGYEVRDTVVYRDNMSTMKLEVNGKASSGKRTRHMDIKFFYITDLIARKLLRTQYCPTDEMISDYMTKPLVGKKFIQFRKAIMNMP